MNEVLVPASNPVMMTLYHCLLDHINCFQSDSLSATSLPDPILIPFLRELDATVKEIVNLDGLHLEWKI